MKKIFILNFILFVNLIFAQLYGEKDFKLKEELSKKYDYVSYLSDDVAVFRTKNQKEGVIDSLGNILIEPKFSYISGFVNGFSEAGNNVKEIFKRGIINKKGEIIIPFVYSELFRCSKDRIRASIGKKTGLIDYSNKIIIPILYDNIYESDDDKMFLVEQKNKVGYFDENGKAITKFEFIFGDRFRNGKASVILENNSGTLINEKGEKLLKRIPNTRIDDYDNENFYIVSNIKTHKKGIISRDGTSIFPTIYDEITIHDDRFEIKRNGKYALFNSQKQQTTKFYNSIFTSINNKFEVDENHKKGVIDKDDNVFLPIIYSDLFVLNEKYYVLKKENFYTVLDENKNVIIPEEYEFYSVTKKNIIAEKEGKFYVISGENFKNFKQILGIDKIYDKWMVRDFESSFLKISNNNKFGIMNLSGRIWIEPQYEDVNVYYSVLPFAVKKNGKWGLVNEKNEVEKDFIYDRIVYVKEIIYLYKDKKKEIVGNRFSKDLLED